ncbi:MAG: hypothetical protein RMJ55_20065 [Roseiflexaceae bacterium]|nr:hypothetical protein [Roseiflexaceae bacterium]
MNCQEMPRSWQTAPSWTMDFEYIFRYPPVRPAAIRPAPEVAGYGCEARLRGLDPAIPD